MAHGKVAVDAVRSPSTGGRLCRGLRLAHGKFCRVVLPWLTTKRGYAVWYFAVRSMSWAAHGIPFAVCPRGFAVCLGHTANILSPVVGGAGRHVDDTDLRGNGNVVVSYTPINAEQTNQRQNLN
jgi:hypothetical protein